GSTPRNWTAAWRSKGGGRYGCGAVQAPRSAPFRLYPTPASYAPFIAPSISPQPRRGSRNCPRREHGRCAVSAFRGVRKCRSPQIPLAKNRTRPESRSPPKETPPQKKSLPQKKSRSPLAGEGRGGGCHTLDARSSLSPTPTPTRPRRGGGGRKKWG